MRNLLIAAGFAIAMPHFAMGPALAQQAWDLSMEDKANSLPGEGAGYFANAVREKTDGQVDITVHYGGSLGFKNKDHLDAVATGALPMAQSLAGTYGGSEPIFLLSSLPFVVASLDDAKRLYDMARPAYEAALAKHNQKLLYATPFPPSGIWAKKAIRLMNDLKGLKIRTYDVNGTTTFKEAGASPLQISFSDLIPQLSAGNIDAVLTSADGGRSMSFWDYLPYFNSVNYAFPLNVTSVNLDSWNALSDEQKNAVTEAAKETEDRDWNAVTTWTKRNYDALQEHKVQIVDDESKEFLHALSEAGQKAVQDWVDKTGDEGKKILDSFEQQAGK